MQIKLSSRAPRRGERYEEMLAAIATINGIQEKFGDLLLFTITAEQSTGPACHAFTPDFVAHLNELFLRSGQQKVADPPLVQGLYARPKKMVASIQRERRKSYLERFKNEVPQRPKRRMKIPKF